MSANVQRKVRAKVVFQHIRQFVQGSRRRALLVVGGLVLLGLGGLAGGTRLWADRHVQIAELALERNDLELAQQHLEQSLSLWNSRVDVHLLAARTARRRDDFDRADAHLTACERLERPGEAALLERALLIAQQGEPDSVRPHLETVLKQRPDQAPPILEALGKGYLNSFINNDALRCFNALLKLQPNHAQALLGRGKTYDRLVRYDRAQADYRRAVELSPSLEEARLRLGESLYRSGRSWEAVPHYECLRWRIPVHTPEVLLGLARCRHDLGELEKARDLLDTLLTDHPGHAAARLELGRLAFHAGRTAEAEKWLRRAAASAPNDHDAHRALLLCLKALGKDAETRSCLAHLEQVDSQLQQLNALIHRTKDRRRDAPLRWEIGQLLDRLGAPGGRGFVLFCRPGGG